MTPGESRCRHVVLLASALLFVHGCDRGKARDGATGADAALALQWLSAARTAASDVTGSDRIRACMFIAALQQRAGDVDAAWKTADMLAEPDQRTSIYAGIAMRHARRGDIRAVKESMARIPTDRDARQAGDYLIVVAQVGAGDLAAAEKTAAGISDRDARDIACSVIAEAHARAGDIAQARHIGGGIAHELWKLLPERAIAAAEARSGKIDAALKTAGAIPNEWFRAWAHYSVAAAQAGAGDFAGAKRTAGAITDNPITQVHFGTIGSTRLQNAYSNNAIETGEGIALRDYASLAYRAIAAAQAKAGDIAGARATADLIAKGSEQRASAYVAIAAAQAKRGDLSGAKATMSATLEPPRARAAALAEFAEQQASSGDPAGAKATLAEAGKIADGISEAWLRADAQWKIARARVRTGGRDGVESWAKAEPDALRRAMSFAGAAAGLLPDP